MGVGQQPLSVVSAGWPGGQALLYVLINLSASLSFFKIYLSFHLSEMDSALKALCMLREC